MSRITQSGRYEGFAARNCRKSSPLGKVSASMPSSRKRRCTARLTDESSSTIATSGFAVAFTENPIDRALLLLALSLILQRRQREMERGAPIGIVLRSEPPTVRLDDRIA